MELKEFQLHQALIELPDVEPLEFQSENLNGYDFFLMALGFETRCKAIAEELERTPFRVKEAILFNYSTNVADNTKNKAIIEKVLKARSNGFLNLESDSSEFVEILHKAISDKCQGASLVKVLFDISACSSKLLLTVLKVLFELDVSLTIFYTEAELYYPTFEEYSKKPDHLKDRSTLGLTQGVETVILSQEYVGDNIDNNPEFIIAFPTFKPDRTKSILIEIDEGVFSEMAKRLVWIVGKPHMGEPEKSNRIRMLREINEIVDGNEAPKSFEICTLNYKETIEILDRIYNENINEYHLNISDLGSKMQSVGISIFCHLRPEVSVYFSVPEKYNPSKYSEGVRDFWKIEFGMLSKLFDLINKIDALYIE